mmetsp:Transcript_18275/g.31141  ORF Transcript_18275/g.31141 Transcript_18275/m.31141 type:complete len:209 (-) Transcript_18275:137-763(-)
METYFFRRGARIPSSIDMDRIRPINGQDGSILGKCHGRSELYLVLFIQSKNGILRQRGLQFPRRSIDCIQRQILIKQNNSTSITSNTKWNTHCCYCCCCESVSGPDGRENSERPPNDPFVFRPFREDGAPSVCTILVGGDGPAPPTKTKTRLHREERHACIQSIHHLTTDLDPVCTDTYRQFLRDSSPLHATHPRTTARVSIHNLQSW